MQTIAQQLKVTDFPFKIKDKNGKTIYSEDSEGYWFKREYDSNGNAIYSEYSDGDWFKGEYDSNGNRIYFENSTGIVYDDRPKTEVQKALELLKKEGMIIDGKIIKN